MFLMTQLGNLVCIDSGTGTLRHVRDVPPPNTGIHLVEIACEVVERLEAAQPGSGGTAVTSGPLKGCELVKTAGAESFSMRRDGLFACAEPNAGSVVFNRPSPGPWEWFSFVSPDAGVALLTKTQGYGEFSERVQKLTESGQPICLHFGCGFRIIDGFLNIDKHKHVTHKRNYFIFDFAERRWPIPDSCVDYIYSEDFIEHIPQKIQIGFLAECFRVLKPGCFNRVNTPCLYETMRKNSDFTRGLDGFYATEFDKWGHISIFTQTICNEIALMIGYRRVFFTGKSMGTSPYSVADHRPGPDRDQAVGNLFADLLK